MATDTSDRVALIARELFDLVTHITMSALRGRRRSEDLKELEFLTLSILQEQGTMIVGDIQRLLGVLPAQMSRIIRALENGDKPLIACRINSTDKRKIDVCLTADGENTLVDYQNVRVARIGKLLSDLSEDDQDDFLRVLDKLNSSMPKVSTEKTASAVGQSGANERTSNHLSEAEVSLPTAGRITKSR
jgi:DNA-binding MarR family transcriptional regulator